jgi:hypothetical protein
MKRCILSFFALSFFSFCGLNTGNKSLFDAIHAKDNIKEFKDKKDILTITLSRNDEIDDTHTYSILKIQFDMPLRIPFNASKDPDLYLGVLMENKDSPYEKIKYKQFLFILGKTFYADFFPVAQIASHNAYELSVMNIIMDPKEGLTQEPTYYQKKLQNINTLPIKNLIMNVTNKSNACAYYCVAESGILPNNILNGNINYTLQILLRDSKTTPPQPRDREVWKISVGFFRKKSYYLLKNESYSSVIIDFNKNKAENEN